MRHLAIIVPALLLMVSPAAALTIECAGKADGALSLFDPGTSYDLVFTINPDGASATLHKPTHQAGKSVPITVTEGSISLRYEDHNYVLGIANAQRQTFNFSVDRYTGTGTARMVGSVVAIQFVCGVLEQKAF